MQLKPRLLRQLLHDQVENQGGGGCFSDWYWPLIQSQITFPAQGSPRHVTPCLLKSLASTCPAHPTRPLNRLLPVPRLPRLSLRLLFHGRHGFRR
jgi:hypothetical protein